jgi:type I restriction enzyme S subunit
MSFPRYPAYKDSGVAWLGEVPAHWSLPKLKQFATFSGGGTPSRENQAYWSGDIPWVSPKDMKTERLTGAEESITATGLANSTASLVPPNRLLMVVRSGILKHTIPVAINQLEVALNQDMKALDFADEGLTSSFFLRWVQGLNDLLLLEWAKQGATVESIEHEYLANTVVPLPTAEERATITSFLDRETAKIDALVAEQEQLITLLKEKRQAVVSHAVTKGLDPSVPMKDSGVEWLGEVPAHWDVAQFRRYVSIAEGQVNPEESPYSEMVLIAPNHVESATGRLIAQETAAEQGAESGKYLCKKGNVIYSKIRPALRKVCLAPVDCLCSADMYPLKSHSGLVSEYLLWYMLSEEFSTLAVLESERVAMPKINRETLNPVAVAVPPEGEQIEIAAYLSMATEGSDRLTTEATLAIDLLQERRSALISAAVTGQIDVRGLALKDAL